MWRQHQESQSSDGVLPCRGYQRQQELLPQHQWEKKVDKETMGLWQTGEAESKHHKAEVLHCLFCFDHYQHGLLIGHVCRGRVQGAEAPIVMRAKLGIV